MRPLDLTARRNCKRPQSRVSRDASRSREFAQFTRGATLAERPRMRTGVVPCLLALRVGRQSEDGFVPDPDDEIVDPDDPPTDPDPAALRDLDADVVTGDGPVATAACANQSRVLSPAGLT